MTLVSHVLESGPSTLCAALWGLRGSTDRGPLFVSPSGVDCQLSFGDLAEASCRAAAGLHAVGLRNRQRFGLLVSDPRAFIETFLGAVLLGAVPVPIAPPSPGLRAAQHAALVIDILAAAHADALLTTEDVAVGLRAELLPRGCTVFTLESWVDREHPEAPYFEAAPQDTCFLQFTSGSTAAPKAVVVTHGNLAANARCIMRDGLRVDSAHDLGVSWLPLHHDMGLIGNVVAPLFCRLPVAYIPTSSFIRRPNIWLTTVDRLRATITFVPTSALALVAKRGGRMVHDLDLSCLRVLGCGAEPIDAEILQTFAARFAAHGLNPAAIIPCYGMAECTLAISFAQRETAWRTVRKRAELGRSWNEFVSCGRPVVGHEVVVLSRSGDVLPSGQCGTLAVRGPSVAAGYYQDVTATQATFRDGWLRTGDWGFIDQGEIFIASRARDLIMIRGRVLYPHFIERAVERVSSVRDNCVVAFGLGECEGDADTLSVVAEVQGSPLRDALISELLVSFEAVNGAVPIMFVGIKPGTLPKTTSGKVRRMPTRSLWLKGELQVVVLLPPSELQLPDPVLSPAGDVPVL